MYTAPCERLSVPHNVLEYLTWHQVKYNLLAKACRPKCAMLRFGPWNRTGWAIVACGAAISTLRRVMASSEAYQSRRQKKQYSLEHGTARLGPPLASLWTPPRTSYGRCGLCVPSLRPPNIPSCSAHLRRIPLHISRSMYFAWAISNTFEHFSI